MADTTSGMKPNEFWKQELESAGKRQREFWKDGDKIVSRFLDERKGEEINSTSSTSRLNLFHANVTTQLAMLYGRVPEVDVSRRYADAGDDIGRIASEIMQRMLSASVEESGGNIKDVLRATLLDRLLPGLGVARVRYDFTTRKEQGEDVEYEVTDDEDALVDYVYWQNFLWGHAHTWQGVPWVGFKTYLTQDEAVARFGAEHAAKLEYSKAEKSDKQDPDVAYPWGRAEIVEIWNKKDRKVVWYSKDCEDLLDTKPDPLRLQGFFPCPEPMAANVTTKLYLPRADFKMAQDLYNQIDLLQTRITILTRAIKVVGVYDKKQDGVKRMLQEGVENDLIPVDSWAAFAEQGGIEGVISWMPIKDIAEVVGKLQELRDENITLLYQVTGMADILRGDSGEYTSASSDQLKAKFASIRVQYLQDEFARFASDLMTLKAEIIQTHYEAESILSQSNAKFMTEDPQDIMEAVQFLKDEGTNFLWRIEIKPESIAMIDYAQLKAERTEYMTAVATFLQSSQSIAKDNPEAGPVLMELLKWGLAGFKGSQQIEGVIDKAIKQMVEAAQEPQEEQQDPKVQQIQLKNQGDMQKAQAKMQEAQFKAQVEANKAMEQFNAAQQDHMNNMQEIMAESDANAQKEKMQAYFNILEADTKAAHERSKAKAAS